MIELLHVTKRYGDKLAVDDLSFLKRYLAADGATAVAVAVAARTRRRSRGFQRAARAGVGCGDLAR